MLNIIIFTMLKSVILIYNDQSTYLSKVEVVMYIQVHCFIF